MKRTAKFALTTTASILVMAGATSNLQANEITGSIGFGSLGVTVSGGSDISTASSFSVTDPFITTETGTYSGVPILTSVTFNGFQFNPPVSSVTPLWTFDAGGLTYTFDATSVSDSYDASTRQWDIGGAGIAMVTGYDATPGTWNVNLSQSGASIVFDSSASAAPTGVPDGGPTVMLLGGGFLGLAGFARKVKGF